MPKGVYFSGISVWSLNQKQQQHLGTCQTWKILGTTPGKLKLHGRIQQSTSHHHDVMHIHFCNPSFNLDMLSLCWEQFGALRGQPGSQHHPWSKHIYACNLPHPFLSWSLHVLHINTK